MGKGTFNHEINFVVKALKLEFKPLSRFFSKNNLTHFARLANTKQSVISTQKYINIRFSLVNEFGVTITIPWPSLRIKFKEMTKFKLNLTSQSLYQVNRVVFSG